VLKGLLNRRIGPVGIAIIVAIGVAVTYAIVQVVPKKGDDEPVASATPTPTATPCTPAPTTFGEPPDSFTYDKVDEKTRATTVKALNLDEADGKVEMVKVARGGLTLGQLVGVPDKTDPADYAASLVAAAQGGGANVTKGSGYAVIPLENGQKVGVGVRGCNTILINAQDPNAVQFLAANVFSAS
jgi:hypothetical protein